MWGSAGARPGVPGASLLAQSSLRPDRGRQSRWCGPPGRRPGGGSVYGGRRKPPRARGRREWPIVGLERDGSPWAPEKQSALWGRADPECVTCAPEPPSGGPRRGRGGSLLGPCAELSTKCQALHRQLVFCVTFRRWAPCISSHQPVVGSGLDPRIQASRLWGGGRWCLRWQAAGPRRALPACGLWDSRSWDRAPGNAEVSSPLESLPGWPSGSRACVVGEGPRGWRAGQEVAGRGTRTRQAVEGTPGSYSRSGDGQRCGRKSPRLPSSGVLGWPLPMLAGQGNPEASTVEQAAQPSGRGCWGPGGRARSGAGGGGGRHRSKQTCREFSRTWLPIDPVFSAQLSNRTTAHETSCVQKF